MDIDRLEFEESPDIVGRRGFERSRKKELGKEEPRSSVGRTMSVVSGGIEQRSAWARVASYATAAAGSDTDPAIVHLRMPR